MNEAPGAFQVTFRRLTDDDLPMLHAWLNEPGVVRWWEGDDVSWEGVVRDYGSEMKEPVEHWLALVDGREVGWIQCYASTSYPDEGATWWDLGVERTAAGIDYLVADPESRGKGLGAAMIGTFVADVVFGMHPQWTQAAAAPLEANAASWRALAKAGFRHLATHDDELGPCKLMVIDRPGPAE